MSEVVTKRIRDTKKNNLSTCQSAAERWREVFEKELCWSIDPTGSFRPAILTCLVAIGAAQRRWHH